MNTIFLLLAEYESATVPLDVVAQKYFGIHSKKAEELANKHALPIPAFKLGSRKSKFIVRIEDLANFIDEKAAQQRAIFEQINQDY